MCSTLCLAMYQTINGTCATYYAQYVLGNNEYFSALNMAETIPQIAVIMILAPFIKKFGKRNPAFVYRLWYSALARSVRSSAAASQAHWSAI